MYKSISVYERLATVDNYGQQTNSYTIVDTALAKYEVLDHFTALNEFGLNLTKGFLFLIHTSLIPIDEAKEYSIMFSDGSDSNYYDVLEYRNYQDRKQMFVCKVVIWK